MPEEKNLKLEECQKKRDEYLAGWQRARADFLNYKKEEMERMGKILKYANEDLILKILPILDNLEKAEKETPDDLKENQYVSGVFQIKKQIEEFLKNQGIEEIKSLGESFDLNFHEVVEEVEGEKTGIIVEEVKKGYKLQDKVIRPAKVKVSK
ncbi:MAG: nucleotide exchange factor GrpE [Candidatus Nealsonbacteria bacterium]